MKRVALSAVAAVLVITLFSAAASAAASSRPKLKAHFPTVVVVGQGLNIGGKVSSFGKNNRVALERQVRGKWQRLLTARLKSSGFSLQTTAPSVAGPIVLRVTLLAKRTVLATSALGHVLITAPITSVKPNLVTSAPRTGQAGTIVVQGDPHSKPGDFIATGIGAATPYGFLGKVTSVSHAGSDTTLSTQPTTLLDAVPNGSIDTNVSTATVTRHAGSRLKQHGAKQTVDHLVSCTGGGSVEVHGSVTVTPSVHFSAHWHWDWWLPHSHVDSATVTGTATASAELTATAKGAASCSLNRTKIGEIDLEPIDVQVGPVPVVLVPRIPIYISADGSVSTTATTGIHGSLSATAGVKYENGSFSPVGSASANWGYDPPTVDSSATLEGAITPTFQLLLYDVAGPQLAFSAGLRFDADTNSDPWWTLTAPVDLSASLTAPLLDLNSGSLDVYHHDFVLAQANDQPPPPQYTQLAEIDWNTDQTDIDLHVFNAQGDHAWYQDQQAIADGQLSADDTDGFGPETFVDTNPSQQLGYGVCYYADHNNGDTSTPTTVTLTWRNPADGQTVTQTIDLSQPGDAAVAGNTDLVPPTSDWCGA